MLWRFTFIVISLFWVTMNVLLWRTEYGRQSEVGMTVPFDVVLKKILTAPDDSPLQVLHHGKNIGFCRWAVILGEARRDDGFLILDAPEGMIRAVTGYEIVFEGNVALNEFANRLRFDFNVQLDTNRNWQELSIKLNLRPSTIVIESIASEKTVRIVAEEENSKTERVFEFSQFEKPHELLEESGSFWALGLLSGMGMPAMDPKAVLDGGVKWEVRNDWVTIGQSPVRVYRLEAKLLNTYTVAIIISRVGEILRVELPDEIVLVNERLTL